jgi:hypothetical protein
MGPVSPDFNDDIYDHIEIGRGGKIKNEDLDVDEIPDELLGEAEELMDQSIRIREEDNKDMPRGNPNSRDPRLRDAAERYAGHRARIRKEERWRERVRERRRETE